ncbi:MAG: hypothetical protein JW849_00555 [Phycisphaerae bacterium]|nr:hypothetical protein [Phycisphaerae bacterium]
MKHQRNISTYLPLALVLGLATLAAAQDKPTAPPAKDKPEAMHYTWDGMLSSRLPKIELKDIRFEDAIEYLRGMVSEKNLNIITQWGSLEVDDPEIKDKKVQVDLKDIPFGQALQTILDAAGAAVMKLGYRIEGNVLTIDTQDKINSYTFTKTYNVKDLIFPDENGALFEDKKPRGLLGAIRSNVDRESWYPNGNGQMMELGGVLIVTQIQANHEAIERLLDNIRKSGFQKLPPTPASQAREVKVRNIMLGDMAETCFDPEIMGIAAVGGLRTETPMEPKDQIQQFEDILSQTTSLGIRNAIRLTLKDLYLETGNIPKAREHLKKIIEENDKAPRRPRKRVEQMRRRPGNEPRNEKARTPSQKRR